MTQIDNIFKTTDKLTKRTWRVLVFGRDYFVMWKGILEHDTVSTLYSYDIR